MKTVLLIDDEPELLEILEYYFKHLNFVVIAVPDIISVEAITKIDPDIIVLDYHVEHKSGGELCQELKVTQETQNIPVLMMSADEELPQLSAASCADGFLAKPFDISALNEAVKKISMFAA
jgi:DNA-binding response OmpR family regulator